MAQSKSHLSLKDEDLSGPQHPHKKVGSNVGTCNNLCWGGRDGVPEVLSLPSQPSSLVSELQFQWEICSEKYRGILDIWLAHTYVHMHAKNHPWTQMQQGARKAPAQSWVGHQRAYPSLIHWVYPPLPFSQSHNPHFRFKANYLYNTSFGK